MSAKEKAVQDIKDELKKQGRCFIAFRRDLNPIMKELVKIQLKAQKLCQNSNHKM